jgi:hypothetical protein
LNLFRRHCFHHLSMFKLRGRSTSKNASAPTSCRRQRLRRRKNLLWADTAPRELILAAHKAILIS